MEMGGCSISFCFTLSECTFMMKTKKYIEDEIERLRTELSVTIPQEIQDAVELGDLKENTEYSSAIARQNFVNIRLEQLINRLEAYNKIDFSQLPKDAVNIGSIVKMRDLKSDKIEYFKVVIGDIDEDAEYTEVTISSPIGQSLKNKKVKDEIVVQLPKGIARYRILQIKTLHNQ